MVERPRSEPVRGRRAAPGTRPIQRIRPASPADPFAPVPREPPAGDVFPEAVADPSVPARSSASSRSRPPGTPYRGFRRPPGRPGPTGPTGPSRLTLVAAALAVLIVLGGVVFGVQRFNADRSGLAVGADGQPFGPLQPGESPDPSSGSASATAEPSKAAVVGPRTGAAAKVKLGVFLGTSPSDLQAFGDWLGREPDYAVDFPTRSTWNDIANPAYSINAWRGSKYRMVYSVALLPWNGNTSIKAGARGDYDQYYRTLARNLVAGGQEDAILRLGWEFNLKGWKWSTNNPKEFIAYWRHIVTAMRSVPGQKLRFDWNPNVGVTPYEADLYYPGGKYVDYVGVDVYDVSWDKDTYPYGAGCNATCKRYRQEEVWDRLLNGHYGLSYWSEFARSKGKPMSLPEWGAWDRPDGHGGGDNAYFIQQMHAFIDDPYNRVAYQAYLQVDVADGRHKVTTLKSVGKAYKRLFK